jgi:hypothetical protein
MFFKRDKRCVGINKNNRNAFNDNTYFGPEILNQNILSNTYATSTPSRVFVKTCGIVFLIISGRIGLPVSQKQRRDSFPRTSFLFAKLQA